MSEITAERIREVYNETKHQMPANAAVVLEVERRIKQRQALGTASGRTRDEVMQAVCEDMARDASPRVQAESVFSITRTRVDHVVSSAEADELFKPRSIELN